MTPNISQAAPSTAATAAAPETPRIPAAQGGIQYNACKNPKCPQFGMPAPEEAVRAVKGPYALSSAGKGYPLLRCNACGETPPLKSNAGIAAELRRISAYLDEDEPPFCPNGNPNPETGEACPNHSGRTPFGTKGAYRSHGTTPEGSKRARCNRCGKVFIVSARPDKGQHETHHNRDIFDSSTS